MPLPLLPDENIAPVSTQNSPILEHPNHKNLLLVIGLIGMIALGVSGYLSWIAWNATKVAGCGGGSVFDCDDVINSRWSRWLGIPVSFLAFGMYASLIGVAAYGFSTTQDRPRKVALSLTVVMGLSAGIAAIWFISIQIFVLKHLCTYCLAAHTCGLIISALLLWRRPLKGKTMGSLSMVSLAGFAVLAIGQLLYKPITYQMIEHKIPANGAAVETFEFAPPVDVSPHLPAETDTSSNDVIQPGTQQRATQQFDPHPLTAVLRQWQHNVVAIATPGQFLAGLVLFQGQQSQPNQADSVAQDSRQPIAAGVPTARRLVSLAGGTVELDVAQWPLAGKQNAKYIFVEMFDYTCDHCRRTHTAITGAKAALGGDVAVVALPVPLNSNCNDAITQTGPRMVESCEISNLAIAVWRVDATQFEPFHHYLMSTPVVVTYAQAIAKANALVDPAQLQTALASGIANQYIAQHVDLYKRVGAGSVPKLLFPGTSIVGEFTSVEGLVDVIMTQLK